MAFSSCLSGLQSLHVVFSQLRICWSLDLAVLSCSAHQGCQRKPCVGQRSLFVQSLMSYRSVPDVCLFLKRQQWHLTTWKVLCKASLFSVFRNGAVCCVQKVSPVLSWQSCVQRWLKPCQAYHRTLAASEGKTSVWVFWLLTVLGFADCCLKCRVGSCKLDPCFPLLQDAAGADVLLQGCREQEGGCCCLLDGLFLSLWLGCVCTQPQTMGLVSVGSPCSAGDQSGDYHVKVTFGWQSWVELHVQRLLSLLQIEVFEKSSFSGRKRILVVKVCNVEHIQRKFNWNVYALGKLDFL